MLKNAKPDDTKWIEQIELLKNEANREKLKCVTIEEQYTLLLEENRTVREKIILI